MAGKNDRMEDPVVLYLSTRGKIGPCRQKWDGLWEKLVQLEAVASIPATWPEGLTAMKSMFILSCIFMNALFTAFIAFVKALMPHIGTILNNYEVAMAEMEKVSKDPDVVKHVAVLEAKAEEAGESLKELKKLFKHIKGLEE